MDNGDVEMFTLRRSSRIADKERQKFLRNLKSNHSPTMEESRKTSPKPTRKKTNEVIKISAKNSGVNVKKARRTKKTTKTTKTTKRTSCKFSNLKTTKINDMFSLIFKYSRTDDDKNEKYIVLQTIIKLRKELKMKNLMTEIYLNKTNIEICVYKHLVDDGFTLMTISNHLNEILSYKEVDDLDNVITAHKAETCNNLQGDCDNLADMLTMMNFESKQTQEPTDEIDKLNSLICGLMI